jgi:hypothetical protein
LLFVVDLLKNGSEAEGVSVVVGLRMVVSLGLWWRWSGGGSSNGSSWALVSGVVGADVLNSDSGVKVEEEVDSSEEVGAECECWEEGAVVKGGIGRS